MPLQDERPFYGPNLGHLHNTFLNVRPIRIEPGCSKLW